MGLQHLPQPQPILIQDVKKNANRHFLAIINYKRFASLFSIHLDKENMENPLLASAWRISTMSGVKERRQSRSYPSRKPWNLAYTFHMLSTPPIILEEFLEPLPPELRPNEPIARHNQMNKPRHKLGLWYCTIFSFFLTSKSTASYLNQRQIKIFNFRRSPSCFLVLCLLHNVKLRGLIKNEFTQNTTTITNSSLQH